MTSPIGKKIEPVKPASKANSRPSQKMFFNETEDEYEQSKMIPHDTSGSSRMKEGNLPISKQIIPSQISSQSMSQENNLHGNQGTSESGQEQDFSDEWSQDQSEVSDVLEVDYQLIRLETVIENSFEQFVNLECVLQPNILNDMGRLRFILIRYVEETIKKSVDDDGQFDVYTFQNLMNDFQTIEHFLYLEYPTIAMEYDQQQEVARYELMSDQQFSDEYYYLLQPEEINKLVELANIQQILQQDYQQALSRNNFMRKKREQTQGPLDSFVSNKQNLFQQLGKFSSNPQKKQQQFKVSIRKQLPQQKNQNKKSSLSKTQQSKQIKPQFQLFNLQPINNDQPSINSQSQANNNKNLTYQQFVTMLEKQKRQQLQRQSQSKQQQTHKEKQRKESQQKKKSHFDLILGRKDTQQSKTYLKPFIGEFKKNESENQLRQLLGLNDRNTPKKQQSQMVDQSTPEFKPNLVNQMQRQRNSSQSMPTNFIKRPQQSRSPQNVTLKSSQNKQITKNTQPTSNRNQPTTFVSQTNLPSTGIVQNQFVSHNPINQQKTPQYLQSKSPASVITSNPQVNDSSKQFQNIQMSQKQPVLPIPSVQGSMNSFQNPFFRNSGPTPQIPVSTGHAQPILSNVQQQSPFNNQTTRQNNLMPQSKTNIIQNQNSNKFQNINSISQPMIPPNNPQIPSSQMFSNLQMNQNTNAMSNSNPYIRGQNSSNITNNMPTISNSAVAGHQLQMSQVLINPPIQDNLSQTTSFNLSNQNIHSVPSPQNFNQNFTPQSNIAQNLPTPSLNGFLGSQKLLNPGLINLPAISPQPINSQNIQSSFQITQKMNSQENQKKSRQISKQLTNLTKNQKEKSPSKLTNIQTTQKANIYDPQILDNMKLKDFINIFCQQELKKYYSDLYSELLLLKKWKILDFRIDSSLYQKLRYLSHFKTKGSDTLGRQNSEGIKRIQKDDQRMDKTLFQEPFPLMMALHKKIEQINQESLFDMYQLQRSSETPSSFKIKKSINFESTSREFNKIEQIQNLLEQKINLLETELEISSSSNNKQQTNVDAYLNMNDQLSALTSTLQNVEKWMVDSGFCLENIDNKSQRFHNQHPLKQNKSPDFNILYQLYANISQIDQDLDIMTENVQKLKD